MKYIDAEKLIAEIKIIQQSIESRDVRFNQVKKIRTECSIEFCKCISDVITSLQQEQPDEDLEKEIENQIRNVFYDLDGIAIMGTSEYASVEDMEYIARHFYDLGQRTKYQQDRAEFAKLKAKEWQDGYDEGYAKGLNARKEE